MGLTLTHYCTLQYNLYGYIMESVLLILDNYIYSSNKLNEFDIISNNVFAFLT